MSEFAIIVIAVCITVAVIGVCWLKREQSRDFWGDNEDRGISRKTRSGMD